MLRYKRLPHPIFSDTMFAKTAAVGGNTCAQVYTTSFGWCRAFPIKRKGEAHESLLLLFQHDGVPPSMIVDNALEQILGDFKRKCREADCHLRQTEPFSPWMQAAEGCIRELKRGVSRLMIKTGSPKKLWDHCIILMAMIRSCSTNSIFMTAGQAPETIMTGETANISRICQFGWFDWVMYHDPAKFPNDKTILGRYLGPAIDVGSTLTEKVLLPSGQYVCRSTLRHLDNDERNSEVHKAKRLEFDQAIDKTHHEPHQLILMNKI
jgi:hypothetical protein